MATWDRTFPGFLQSMFLMTPLGPSRSLRIYPGLLPASPFLHTSSCITVKDEEARKGGPLPDASARTWEGKKGGPLACRQRSHMGRVSQLWLGTSCGASEKVTSARPSCSRSRKSEPPIACDDAALVPAPRHCSLFSKASSPIDSLIQCCSCCCCYYYCWCYCCFFYYYYFLPLLLPGLPLPEQQ